MSAAEIIICVVGGILLAMPALWLLDHVLVGLFCLAAAVGKLGALIMHRVWGLGPKTSKIEPSRPWPPPPDAEEMERLRSGFEECYRGPRVKPKEPPNVLFKGWETHPRPKPPDDEAQKLR